MSNFEPIYDLHRILRSRRHPAPTQLLMDELECSRSTLHRRIEYLRDRLGAPIRNKPGRGYFYDPNAEKFELPGLWFKADELEALLVMDHLLKGIQPSLLHDRLSALRNRVNEILNAGVGNQQGFPAHRIRILRSHARRVETKHLISTAAAVVERRQLAFSYSARSSGEETRRTASPQRLVFYRDQWYLDCWDEGKEALRIFSLDRMRDVRTLKDPARDVSEEELDAAFTAGYGIFAGPARQEALLRFSPERARWVADESWHPQQEGQWLADGRYELRIPYADPRELLGEILRNGAEVEVVEPQELIDLVRNSLEHAAVQYRTK